MNHNRQEILEWAQAGRVEAQQLRRALEVGGVLPDRTQWRAFLDRLLLWLGSVMVAAAAIFCLMLLVYRSLQLRNWA